MEGPKDVEVRLGGEATFACKVAGDPKPEVKWTRDSNEVRFDRNHVLLEDGSLRILRVDENDVGEYECIAQSQMGTTKSRKARALITVANPLRFTVSPQSQTVRSEEDVVLHCRAEGDPAPKISWWRNGQQIFPSARFSITDNGSWLNILAVKDSDSARYVCQARNYNEYLETSADIRVISRNKIPPKIIYRPEDMVAESGATLEVPCRAEGDPRPVINWKKDGSTIGGNKHKIARAGSLFLYNVTLADTGRYECLAFNEHGRDTAQALVKVRRPEATDALIIRAFNDATKSIDSAINKTFNSLVNSRGTNRVDPFRLSRYPDAVGRANARPAELFERTLVNIRRLVNSGVSANATDGKFERAHRNVFTIL